MNIYERMQSLAGITLDEAILVRNKETGNEYEVQKPNPSKHEIVKHGSHRKKPAEHGPSQYKEVKDGEETGKGYETIVYSDGDQVWGKDGKLHREDGPAIVEYGTKYDSREWFLHGKPLNKGWFLENPDKIKKMKAEDLFTKDELEKLGV